MSEVDVSSAPRTAPGPRAWPLVGNVLDVRASGDLLSFFGDQWAAHGDVFRVQMLTRKMLVVVHPDSIKQVLSSRRQNYVKGSIYDGTRRVLGDGLLTIEGDAWKARRAVMQPAFHRQSLERLTVAMAESGAEALDALRNRLKSRRTGESLVIDAHREMVKVTLDVVIRALFGPRVVSAADVSYESLGAALELMSASSNGVLLPAWVPTPHNLKFNRTMRELDGAVYKLIAAGRTRAKGDGSLLSMLLSAVDEAGAPLSDKTVRDEVFTLFVAGHETTALTLSWIFALLDGRADVLARMQTEVDAVLGGRDPTFADVGKLAYVKQVIEETLRLRSPVPMLPRNAVSDDTIGGYRVRAGETILMLLWGTHRHPEFWPDAERFDPDRFSAERSKGRNSWSYVPFSAGPRTCIGNMFSLVESAVLIAQILNRFSIEVQSCADVKSIAIATMRPSKPIHVVLRPR